MSDELTQAAAEAEVEAAPKAPPTAPLSPAQARVQTAMEGLGRALSMQSGFEKTVLGTLQKQVEQSARLSGEEFDKRLEFCYAIVQCPDLMLNHRLQTAAQAYIDAAIALKTGR